MDRSTAPSRTPFEEASAKLLVRLQGNRVTELSMSLYSDFDDGQLQYADKRCRNKKS